MTAVIAIANQKGGVGKTTVTINLGAALALILSHENQKTPGRVLLVDLDPQTHAAKTLAGGIFGEPSEAYDGPTLAELLINETSVPTLSIVQQSQIPIRGAGNLDYLPTHKGKMNRASRLLQGEVDGQYRLHEVLEPLYDLYRYIVIDTPPTLDALTVNSLIAATHVLIPVELAAFSFDGLQGVLDTIQRVQKRQNPDLKVLGILPSRCAFQRAEQREIYEHLEQEYAELLLPPVAERADVTYANSEGLDIFSFRPPRGGEALAGASPAAQDFAAMANAVRKRLIER
ncbi:MAG: hypothetical protein DWQ07_17725 [Chloroflexi bacterium]|nr:MAG: hypothetical protein DWQ07_17725 [Chloroflexota bacterium]